MDTHARDEPNAWSRHDFIGLGRPEEIDEVFRRSGGG